MIEIMKASAGSGKTFNLARRYVEILLESDDEFAYRHILAVTFTNKATEEMKSRILKELDVLALDPRKSKHFDHFSKLDLSARGGLKALCGRILCNILHDYGSFSVSTIDKFFQRTLKAFSREIGQFASYQVELDKNSLVTESVDRILDSLTEKDTGLLKWLTDNVREQLISDGRFSIDRNLYDVAISLKSDEYRNLIDGSGLDERKIYSKSNLGSIRVKCDKLIGDYESEVEEAASAVMELLSSKGVLPSESNGGFLNAISGYASIRHGQPFDRPSDSFFKKAADSGLWFSKTKAPAFLPLVAGALEGPLDCFCSLFGMRYKVYRTALVIKGQVYDLGIAGELNSEFEALLKEKNVLSIDDSNHILKNIIDGSDTPFIYEKIGVRFDNFLLDEFQDTSSVQWDNFRPLLEESDSKGKYNLIVGDVKQSIYRWRGSDWNLLQDKIASQFHNVKFNPLNSNFRSLGNIVEFNNGFYVYAAALLDKEYGDEGQEGISKIYADVGQKVESVDPEAGNVKLTFCDKDKEGDEMMSAIRDVINAGGKYGDIAILVRTNNSGAEAAALLMENHIPTISDDSLDVKSSVIVRRLASLLSFAENPKDKLNAALADSVGINPPGSYHSLVDLCEELLRSLKQSDPENFNREIAYIQSFMDDIHDWSLINGNSLADYLKYWKDANPKISSPEDVDSVRISTIHKAKGLSFPYVIFPYAEKVTTYSEDFHWCRPAIEGTGLSDFADGLYRVRLSSKSRQTLFAKDYDEEKLMQFIDNLNTFYVATTRAEKGMHIISEMPSQICRKACSDDAKSSYDFSNLSQILYWYAHRQGLGISLLCNSLPEENDESEIEVFEKGSMPDFARIDEERDLEVGSFAAEYPSFPLNPGRERLSFSRDSVDFFSEDGLTGMDASSRVRGIVLHDILSRVTVPSDLDAAVDSAFLKGEINAGEVGSVSDFLRNRITEVAYRGWFPDDPSKVRNEASVIDTDGSVYRPDRVVFTDDGVIVIDYKFAEEQESHMRQIGRYASIYGRMGFRNVSAALWYVDSGKVAFSSELF